MTAANPGHTAIMILIMVGMLSVLPGTMAPGVSGKKVYGAKGQSFEFYLEQQLQGPNLTSIIWKCDQDKAAEWFEGDEKPTYFGIFKSTATLDIKTGALTISNLQPHFSGKYSAQVNYKDSTHTLNLLVVDAVRVYGVKGRPIKLQPEVPKITVESAQWILNDRVIAHWDQEVSESSDPSLLLDNSTFSLAISFLQENHTGLYIFTINSRETKVSYQLGLKVRLVIKKQCNSTTCNLRCTGADNETPLITWSDNKGRKMSGPVWVVEKSEHLDLNYNCSSSSGSWETISERELFADYLVKDPTGRSWGIILGPVIGLLFIVVMVVVCIKYKDQIWNMFQRPQHPQDQPQPQQEPQTDEHQPLNRNGHAQPNGDAQIHEEIIEMMPPPGAIEDQVSNPAVQVDVVCEDAS